MAGPLDDLLRQIDLEPAMRRWAEATQRRNATSIMQRAGPGGEPLAPNRPYTIRRKRGDLPGIGVTRQMFAALTSPGGFAAAIGPDSARAEVYAGRGATVKKINIFIRGQTERVIEKTAKGRKPWKRRIPRVPGRDFVGHDEAVVEAAALDLVADIARQWGFVER